MENKILVIYVGVGNIRTIDIPDFTKNVGDKLTPSTFEGEIIIVPVTGNDTRVECINPKYITNKELIVEHENLMNEINENLKHQLNQLNNNKNDEPNK